MSGFYQKPSLSLLYDLINKDNPNLPYVVSASTFVLHSGPKVMDPTTNNGRNTQVVMRAVPGGGYRGLVTLNYNRIDFANLFKDIEVIITHYTATQFYNLIEMFNSVYGMALTTDEMSNPSWQNSASATSATVTTAGVKGNTSSLAFIGTIPKFTWKRGSPSLETLISRPEPAMTMPAVFTTGYDFSQRYRGMDFTPIRTEILNVNSSNTGASWQTLAAKLKEVTGDPWQYNNSGNQPFNIYGASLALISVPGGPSNIDNADYYYTDTTHFCRIILNGTYNNNMPNGGNGLTTYLMLPYNG